MKKVGLWLFVCLGILYSCNENKEQTLKYEISCQDCFIVYYKENQEQVSVFGNSGEWSHELPVRKGFVALLVAQNMADQPALVKARLMLNGEVLKEAESTCPISGTVLVTDTIQ
jgi:hypothetical protein